jgi:hypothetical protein
MQPAGLPAGSFGVPGDQVKPVLHCLRQCAFTSDDLSAPCSGPLLARASQAWAAGSAALHLLVTSYQAGPAREAMQRSLRSFWESIAAALLQPELPLQDFAALACGLHQQGRSLSSSLITACMMQTGAVILTHIAACASRHAERAAGGTG